ncbi:MAG: phage holin family protein [Lachnospiraceae bacterium]|nr:phage holin family protein [Lachnospiraceae bacterium]
MDAEKKLSTVKGGITFVGAVLGDKFALISPIMILLILLMIADYISGMLASRKEAVEHPDDKRFGWSSKKSIMGIYKKVGYILTILVGFSTDYIIYKLVAEMGLSYQTNTFFGFLIIIWFIINELLSILENAARLGAALPTFIQNALAELKKDIDNHEAK